MSTSSDNKEVAVSSEPQVDDQTTQLAEQGAQQGHDPSQASLEQQSQLAAEDSNGSAAAHESSATPCEGTSPAAEKDVSKKDKGPVAEQVDEGADNQQQRATKEQQAQGQSATAHSPRRSADAGGGSGTGGFLSRLRLFRGRHRRNASTGTSKAQAGSDTKDDQTQPTGNDSDQGAYAELSTSYPSTIGMFSSPGLATNDTAGDAPSETANTDQATTSTSTQAGEEQEPSQACQEHATAQGEQTGRPAEDPTTVVTSPSADTTSQDDHAYAKLSTAFPSTIGLFASPLPPSPSSAPELTGAAAREQPTGMRKRLAKRMGKLFHKNRPPRQQHDKQKQQHHHHLSSAAAADDTSMELSAHSAEPTVAPAYAEMTVAYPSTISMFAPESALQAPCTQPDPVKGKDQRNTGTARRFNPFRNVHLRLPRGQTRDRRAGSDVKHEPEAEALAEGTIETHAYAELSTTYPSTIGMFATSASPPKQSDEPTRDKDAAVRQAGAPQDSNADSASANDGEAAVASATEASQVSSAYAELSTAYPSTIGMFASPLTSSSASPEADATPVAQPAHAAPSTGTRIRNLFRRHRRHRETATRSAEHDVSLQTGAQETSSSSTHPAYAELSTAYPSTIGMFASPIAAATASAAATDAAPSAEREPAHEAHARRFTLFSRLRHRRSRQNVAGAMDESDVEAEREATTATSPQPAATSAYADLSTAYPSMIGLFASPLPTSSSSIGSSDTADATARDGAHATEHEGSARGDGGRRRFRLGSFLGLHRRRHSASDVLSSPASASTSVTHSYAELSTAYPSSIGMFASPLPATVDQVAEAVPRRRKRKTSRKRRSRPASRELARAAEDTDTDVPVTDTEQQTAPATVASRDASQKMLEPTKEEPAKEPSSAAAEREENKTPTADRARPNLIQRMFARRRRGHGVKGSGVAASDTERESSAETEGHAALEQSAAQQETVVTETEDESACETGAVVVGPPPASLREEERTDQEVAASQKAAEASPDIAADQAEPENRHVDEEVVESDTKTSSVALKEATTTVSQI